MERRHGPQCAGNKELEMVNVHGEEGVRGCVNRPGESRRDDAFVVLLATVRTLIGGMTGTATAWVLRFTAGTLPC
jgi:hypothetical protein